MNAVINLTVIIIFISVMAFSYNVTKHYMEAKEKKQNDTQ